MDLDRILSLIVIILYANKNVKIVEVDFAYNLMSILGKEEMFASNVM